MNRSYLSRCRKSMLLPACAFFLLFAALMGSEARTAESAGNFDSVVNEISQGISAEIDQKAAAQAALQQEAVKVASFWRLSSTKDIPDRITTLKQLGRACGDVVAVIRAAPARAFLKAEKKGLSREEAMKVSSMMKSSLDDAKATPKILKIQADREWAKLHIEAYSLLLKEKANWTPATGDGKITISEKAPAFRDKIIALIETITKVEDRADRLVSQYEK